MTLIKVDNKLNSLNNVMADYEYDELGWTDQMNMRDEQFRRIETELEVGYLEDEIAEEEIWGEDYWEDLEDDDF
jgi:hypothetical protein